jgi:hypothetical protein
MEMFEGHEARLLSLTCLLVCRLRTVEASAIYRGGEMQKRKALTLQIAGTFALATLVGASAFAESRHLGGTRGGGSSRGSGGFSRGFSGSSHGFTGSSRSFGGFSRGSSGRGSIGRPNFSSRFGGGGSRPSYGSRQSYGRSAPRVYRNSPRAGTSYGRGGAYRGGNYYNNGSRFYGRGRVDRVVPYHGGYHVYLGGWGYPFFVPYRFYDPFRFRIGLFVGFNAFYDPLGYYSVYGWPGYYPPPVYAAGPTVYRDGYNNYDGSELRGVVESIDLRSGTVLVIEDGSNRRTTALLPPRDRRVDDIRVGDYVELSGSWVRGRNYDFDSDTLDRLDPTRR